MSSTALMLPKVVFVIDYFKNSGAGSEGQLFLLAKAYVAAGADVHLLVLRSSDFLESGNFPCPYSVVGRSKLMDPRTWRASFLQVRRLKNAGYNIFHVFFNDCSVIFPPICRLLNTRCLISRRDMGYWYTPLYLNILRITGRFVDGVVVNSRAVGDMTGRSEHIPDKKIYVIYNGYNQNFINENSSEILDNLLPTTGLLIGLVANIRPIKRIEDAIKALGLLHYDTPDVYLAIIGDGDAKRLSDLSKECGVQSKVIFLGPRSDVSTCLKKFDIALLCSESEGFSNAIVEYMLAGLPVVCTETGGNPEAVTDGVTGMLYPVGDLNVLADKLKTLIKNSELRKEMGTAAAKEASKRFGIQTMLDAHIELYGSL